MPPSLVPKKWTLSLQPFSGSCAIWVQFGVVGLLGVCLLVSVFRGLLLWEEAVGVGR